MQNYVVIDKKNSNNGITLEERPDPKYKVGDWIKLKSGRKGRICYPASWNDWSEWQGVEPQWYYTYDYYSHSIMGSEGSVLESDIAEKIDLKKKHNKIPAVKKTDPKQKSNKTSKSSKIVEFDDNYWWVSSNEDY